MFCEIKHQFCFQKYHFLPNWHILSICIRRYIAGSQYPYNAASWSILEGGASPSSVVCLRRCSLTFINSGLHKHETIMFINKMLFINTVYKHDSAYRHERILFMNIILFINVCLFAGPTRAPVYKQAPVYKCLFMFVYLPSRLE